MKGLTPYSAPAFSAPPSYVGTRQKEFDARRSTYNWKAANTTRLHTSLSKAASNAGLASFGFIGDSLTAGANNGTTIDHLNSWPLAFRRCKAAVGVPNGGDGVVPAGTWPTGQPGAVDPRWGNYAAWTNYGGYIGTTTSGATLTFTQNLPNTTIDLWYFDNSGPFTVTVDGGPAVTPARGGTFAISHYSLTGLTNKPHSLTVTTTSTTTVAINGAGGSQTNGLLVHNLGIYGSMATEWATNTTDYTTGQLANRTMMANYTPQVVFIELGANDMNNGHSVAQIKTDVQTVINFYIGSADIILFTPTQAATTASSTLEPVISGLYDLADANDVPLVDMYHRTGGYTKANANGIMGSDSTHLSPSGYNDWGALVADLAGVPSNSTQDTFSLSTVSLGARGLPGTMIGTGSYDPTVSLYNWTGSTLQKTKVQLAKAAVGAAACEIMCVGGSCTEGFPGQPATGSYPYFLTRALRTMGLPAQSNWVNTQLNQTAGRYDSRWTFVNFSKYTSYRISSMYSTAANATATFVSDAAGTQFDLVYTGAYGAFTIAIDGGANAYSYSINGGASTPVAAGANISIAAGGSANQTNVLTVTGLPSTTHNVVITATTVTSIYLVKARVYTPGVGVLVSNSGFGGSTSSDWDTTIQPNATYGMQGLSATGSTPTLVIFEADIWVNDFNINNWTVAQFQASLTRIIQQYQARGCDVLLLAPTSPSTTSGFGSWAAFTDQNIQTFRQAIYAVCDATGVAYVDNPDRDGNWATMNANGIMVDAYHKTPAGFASVAQHVAGILSPPGTTPAPVGPVTTRFTTVQTATPWVIPSNATRLTFRCLGPGGGGGSGRCDAAATVRCGGGGGGGGAYTEYDYLVSDIGGPGATIYATVGTPGTGGASVSTVATNGNAGTGGSPSAIRLTTGAASLATSLAEANGGIGGSGGTNAAGTGAGGSTGKFNGGAGASASTTGATGNSANWVTGGAAPGGGSGGGITSADAVSAGGGGGASQGRATTLAAAGAAGAAGNDAIAPIPLNAGGSGGGGGSSKTAAAGRGGNGAAGAGGAGGGASLTGFASGAGGNGGAGYVEIVVYYS